MKRYALVNDQGTAMSETTLTEAEYWDEKKRLAAEKIAFAAHDAPKELRWEDVTENDACR